MILCSIAAMAIAGLSPTLGRESQSFNIVVVTTRKTSETDIQFLKCKSETEISDLAKAKQFVVIHDGADVIVYSDNIFNLRQAKEQTQLLKTLSTSVTSKAQSMNIADLDDSSQKRVRTIIGEDPQNAQMQYAASASNLKFRLMPSLTVDLDLNGNKVEGLQIDPYMDGPSKYRASQDNILEDLPPGLMSATPLPKPKSVDETIQRAPTPYLLFLYSDPNVSASKKIKWARKFDEKLEEECSEAERNYDQAYKGLMDKLTALYPDTFGNLPSDRQPKLSDFSQEAQKDILQQFGNSQQGKFGSQAEAQAYLANATTTSSSLSLTLRVNMPMSKGPQGYTSQEFIFTIQNPLGRP